MPDSPCPTCQQPHITPRGTWAGQPSCSGHVIRDRASYVKGEDRKLLDQPRPCAQTKPKSAPDGWKCRFHGGAAGQVKAKRERRDQEAEAIKLMLTLGEPVEGSDPGQVIAERIDARRGHVRWLLARVRTLEPDALTWGLTKRKTAVDRGSDNDGGDSTPDVTPQRRSFAGTDEGDTHEARPHVWYALYEKSAAELERLCIEAIRVGLDERRVRIDERMADMWVRVIDGMLLELGHDPNDPATAEIVARHLELVA